GRPAPLRRGRQGARRRAGHPLHPPVVHGHPGPAQVVLDRRPGARRRVRRRHGLRRLLHHGLQRHRGVRHGRGAGPDDLRGDPLAARGAGRRADVLRHPDPRAHAVRGRPAPRPAARAGADAGHGLRHLQRRPRARVLPLPRQQGHGGPRRGRLLRPHDARRGLGRAARDRPGARAAGHPRRVLPPRGRPVPARGRHALRRRAEDGRRLHDVPHHGQGVRHEVRLARDVHAQAPLRRERLGDAHPPEPLQRRPQRVLRPGRHLLPLRRRQGLHRRPAAPRARAELDLRPVGELLQAPRAGLRGAGLRRLEPAQPVRARPRAGLPPRPRVGDADGAALPRPGVQPLPDLRRAPAGGPGGDREGLRAARAHGEEPLPPGPGRPPAAGDRAAPRDAGGGHRAHGGVRARPAHARRAHVQPLRRDQAPGVGGLPRPGDPVGAGPVPARAV
ncbi:MAG: Glutamine synthetase type I, partial [uncultured Solirubrobacteraceae bacterium]